MHKEKKNKKLIWTGKLSFVSSDQKHVKNHLWQLTLIGCHERETATSRFRVSKSRYKTLR